MGSSHYLVFTLEGQHYALGLEAIERVVRAVELTSVPEAPEILVGLINIRGKIVPVLDIRRRFHLPPRDMEIRDRIIVSRTSSRTIAIIADTIEGVAEFAQEETHEARKILPDMEGYVEGVGKLNDDTVLIYDINKLFSINEIRELNIDDPLD
ncbi:MAG: chemotaxis protein CheW [Thermodesulfobacteriota bacterium]|nr:chemotaxis protein CheW [Thermodesulfobacteriota bacterium]